jgi:hypothetical protein
VLSTNWVALGGIAQLIAAAATIGLAVVTTIMAIKTRDVAKQTQLESSATQSLAAEAANILNTGSGPAIDVKLALRSPADVNIWSILYYRDLKSAGNRERGGHLVYGSTPYDLFDDPGDTTSADVVLFCSDVLDRRYRFPFLDAVGSRDATWRPLPPEIYSTDDPVDGRPNWVNQPKLWATPEWPVRPRSDG